MARPNVLVFVTDGHRAGALGCYGNSFAQTPHFDALAAEGVRFEQAYCVHSVCMPTRASMVTGRYPQVHGVWANGIALRKGEVTLPQVLGEAGYATAACGKVHFEPQQPYGGVAPRIEGRYYGFDEVHLTENTLGQEYLDWIEEQYPELAETVRGREGVPEEAHELQWIADRAIAFMSEQAQAERPFFCQCSFHELSPPCTPPPTFEGCFRTEDMPVPELREEDLAGKPAFYRECYEG
ncbi:MAG: sulfatase-like hydrolase/transferase, partial [Armatimonadia bacterium]